MRNLKKLGVFINGTAEDVEIISKLNNLSELSISCGSDGEKDFSALGNLKNLKELDLDGIGNTSKLILKDIEINSSSIETLCFNYVTLKGSKIIDGLKKLRFLSMDEISVENNFSIHNQAIKRIDFYESSEALKNGIFNEVINLEEIWIINRTGSSNNNYDWAELSNLKNLKFIDIVGYHMDNIDY